MPMKNPPHPGDLIRTEIIEALGLNVSKAAAILKVRRATLSDLLHGKATLTPEMALRIEKAFGPDMNHLLRMQLAYDVAKTRQHTRDMQSNLMFRLKFILFGHAIIGIEREAFRLIKSFLMGWQRDNARTIKRRGL